MSRTDIESIVKNIASEFIENAVNEALRNIINSNYIAKMMR